MGLQYAVKRTDIALPGSIAVQADESGAPIALYIMSRLACRRSAQHMLETFRRTLLNGITRTCLDRLSNIRITIRDRAEIGR